MITNAGAFSAFATHGRYVFPVTFVMGWIARRMYTVIGSIRRAYPA